ncbi:MAG: hypothetical protein ACXVI9_09075 [Mucilaginibacter sp.]
MTRQSLSHAFDEFASSYLLAMTGGIFAPGMEVDTGLWLTPAGV